jgi:hypothetical protein
MCLACKEWLQDTLTWKEWSRNSSELLCFGTKEAWEKWDREKQRYWDEDVMPFFLNRDA